MNIKNWEVLPFDRAQVISLAEKYRLPSVLAMLFQVRGLTQSEQIDNLLGRTEIPTDPFEIKDMDKAADRIMRAIENFEKIAIFGDYDADGVTSTAILYTYLEESGADVMWYIPKRDGEGYGMNIQAVDLLKEQGVELIVTVDNGISSVNEIAHAKELGMETVVTDHHRPHEVLPDAVAVVDPYTEGNEHLEFRDYSGAGIAFKLIQAIETEIGDPEELLERYADIATIGIIGDIVPLVSENRRIVKKGLEKLADSERIGIRSLIEKAGAAEGISHRLLLRLRLFRELTQREEWEIPTGLLDFSSQMTRTRRSRLQNRFALIIQTEEKLRRKLRKASFSP